MLELWNRRPKEKPDISFVNLILEITRAHENATNAECKGIEPLYEAVGIAKGEMSGDDRSWLVEFTERWLSNESDRQMAFATALDLGMSSGPLVGEMSSSKSMAAVMATAALAGARDLPKSPRVWDPCCGSGRGLVEMGLRLSNSAFNHFS